MIPPGYEVRPDGTIIGKLGKPLRTWLTVDGYATVGLTHQGRTRTRRVHQLVCETFHGPKPFPEAQVRHLDGDPSNNRVSNLAWGTAVENQADRVRHGTDNRGERSHTAKLTWAQVKEIRARYAGGTETYAALGREYGTSYVAILKLVQGETWQDPDYTSPSKPKVYPCRFTDNPHHRPAKCAYCRRSMIG